MRTIEIFANWKKAKKRCCWCGTDKSVKYKVKTEEHENGIVHASILYACNMCALKLMGEQNNDGTQKS